jgi:ATP-dependent Clp protease ATP-binding subunit ClpB
VPIGVGTPRRLTVDRVVISVEGNVLTFNGKAPQTAEIAQFEAPTPKRRLH